MPLENPGLGQEQKESQPRVIEMQVRVWTEVGGCLDGVWLLVRMTSVGL